ncbi:MAG TPA: ATP-NAD kinase [Clostridiales bacterium]|nr:ATP-NAD kinase [Clostridiales bacterium]
MGKIGLVVNPNSGKDIRRITSHATTIGNMEKVNIVRRILAGIYELSGHTVYSMPDQAGLSQYALNGMNQPGIAGRVILSTLRTDGDARDTIRFVDYIVREEQVDVVIVLGGDGTSRAAAKVIGDVPLIPVSTGTNNVYPVFMEGTAVAAAAAAIADGVVKRDEIARGKRIEVEISDGQRDIALVDAVLSKKDYVGARAIVDESEISALFVSQAHPASIGFSALAGVIKTISPEEDGGMYLELDWEKKDYIAAVSAGVLTRFGVRAVRAIGEEELVLAPGYQGTVALDGEREMTLGEQDTLTLRITRHGPRKVAVKHVVEMAAARGYLHPGSR